MANSGERSHFSDRADGHKYLNSVIGISGSFEQFFKGFQLLLFSKLEMDLELTWNGSIFQNAFWVLGLAGH